MHEDIQYPKKLPDENHVVVVALETVNVPMPDSFDLPGKTCEVIHYKFLTAADDVAARLRDASVVVTVTCPINATTLGEAKHLKCVITQTTGYNHIDLDECRRRGIRVMITRGAAKEAVSEHAIALYFAARRRIPYLHNTLYDWEEGRPNDYGKLGSLSSRLRTAENKAPPSCEQEIVGMIGYGTIGRRIAILCRALGMKVLIAARKGAEAAAVTPAVNGTGDHSNSASAVVDSHALEQRTPFDHVLRTATVLMLALPLAATSTNLISHAELAMMRPDAVIVNISRGGIVDERALLAALRERRIYGYGTDVFEHEPAGSDADTPLLGRGEKTAGLNLALTPHLAWNGDMTMVNILRGCTENVTAWAAGQETENVIV